MIKMMMMDDDDDDGSNEKNTYSEHSRMLHNTQIYHISFFRGMVFLLTTNKGTKSI